MPVVVANAGGAQLVAVEGVRAPHIHTRLATLQSDIT